jgi:hypothetical protein
MQRGKFVRERSLSQINAQVLKAEAQQRCRIQLIQIIHGGRRAGSACSRHPSDFTSDC